MKRFTLIRYNKKTPFLEMGRINIAEPDGYKDLDFDLKRDSSVHGVFFEFSTELKFYNYWITDNNIQVLANAYDFIKSAYAQDGINTRIQLLVIEDSLTLFDLYFNMQSFDDDPLNKIWSCNCETKEPFLLKDRQEQKVKLAADKTIQLRQTDIINFNKATINEPLSAVGVSSLPFSPPLDWTENNRNGLRITESYAANEIFAFLDSPGVVDFRLNLLILQDAQVTAKIILARDLNKTDIAYEFTAVSSPYTLVISNVQLIDFTVSQAITEKLYLFINLSVPNTGAFTYNFFFYPIFTKRDDFFELDNLPYEPGETVIYGLEMYVHQVISSTPCTGELLPSVFEQILAKSNLNLQSNILNDLEKLGSIFITLGRRIARATTEIDLSLNFKDTFEEAQKMFNLGYGISGTNVIIESINYFYDKSAYYTLPDISELKIGYANEFSYNVFLCGYDKFKEDKLGKLYENEAYNSRREYNIEGTVAEKKLDVKTKFIASNWIVEKLRRDVDKNDDEQIFIFALNRAEITSTKYNADATSTTYPANTVVEGIEPYDETDNEYYGLDKENIFNIRLSPRRIAMNWESVLKTSLYKFDALDQKALFISGEPKTQLKVADVIENENIDLSSSVALFKPEKYKLKAFLSIAQFIDIKSNYLYKLIKFEYNLSTYEGFILSAKYNFNTALLELTLIANSDD